MITVANTAPAAVSFVRRRYVLPIGAGYAILVALLVGSCLLSLSMGRFPTGRGEVVRFVLCTIGLGEMPRERFDALFNVLVDIRLPRVLSAALVGSCLATSGASLQAIFRNPLVSPSLMGVQAGAAFGAALGMLLSSSEWVVQALAFGAGLAAVAFGVGVASVFGRSATVMLILGGMISNSLFSSLLSLVKYVADPLNVLPSIVYFLMGTLSLSNLHQASRFSIPMVAGVACLSLFGRALDAMSMGEDEARSLGVPVHFIRLAVIALATLISALSVSLAGIVGWVGLVVPHIVRLALGPSNRTLLLANALAGASFLILADCVGRTLVPTELPIGILTELLGIPVFLLVLCRSRRAWT
jgi:iron complex transport system permease protein